MKYKYRIVLKMEKICKDGKVVNPRTGRCIKKENLEKQLQKDLINDKNPNKNIISNLKILQEYEIINKEPYKANAYEKVIEEIELYDKPIKAQDDIKEIKGIGKKIEDKIMEYLETGKMNAVERVLQDPKYILGKKLLGVYGIGPVKIGELVNTLSSFDELKNRTELLNEKQKIGLLYHDDMQKRIPMEEGKKHFKLLEKTFKSINKDIEFEMVGSYRRKNKDMGDIDILIKNRKDIDLKLIINILQSSGYILESLASGKNKFMGICKLSSELPARRIDILIAEPEYYYFALLYFTGSYTFNIYMRRIALQKGLSLSEYGIKDNKTKKMIDTSNIIHSEEDIFKYLDIQYVVPSKR